MVHVFIYHAVREGGPGHNTDRSCLITSCYHDSSCMHCLQYVIVIMRTICLICSEALCCKSGWEFEEYYTAVERGEDFK